MTADVSGATTVYYTAYVGNNVPIANATTLQNSSFASELKLDLDSVLQSGNIYDVFLVNQSGAFILCAGPAWSTSTSRGTGTGSTQLALLSGLSVNALAIGSCVNGSTSLSVPAKSGFYLGSIYMTANGQTTMQFKPSPAAGGTNNVIGIWNAYNRVRISSLCSDRNTNWTYAGTTWAPLDNSTNNRVTFIDGLGQSSVVGRVATIAYNAVPTNGAFIGINEDNITNTPAVRAAYESAAAGNDGGAASFAAVENFPPALGVHYLQAVQLSPNGTVTTFAFNGGQTFLLFEGEY